MRRTHIPGRRKTRWNGGPGGQGARMYLPMPFFSYNALAGFEGGCRKCPIPFLDLHTVQATKSIERLPGARLGSILRGCLRSSKPRSVCMVDESCFRSHPGGLPVEYLRWLWGIGDIAFASRRVPHQPELEWVCWMLSCRPIFLFFLRRVCPSYMGMVYPCCNPINLEGGRGSKQYNIRSFPSRF
jgi:hypothetical protein